MTMHYCVQIGDPLSKDQQTTIEKILISTFSEVHRIYNNWNRSSEISILNHLPANHRKILSPELSRFLKEVDRLVQLTEGRFDPTIGSLQILWKEKLNSGQLPTEEEITSLIPSVGWQHIHLKGNMFWKDHDLTAIDLGAVAKGYAVDLLIERIQEAGCTSIYVEWGGEVRTVGSHPQGREWRVALLGSSSRNLSNQAIATSGSYFQKWSVDGTTFTHLINPQHKQPLIVTDQSIISVHVISQTCTQADALATALMLFSSKLEAEKWTTKNNIWAQFQ